MPQTFRVRHPFHPLFDQEIDIVGRRVNFGRRHLYYHDERGRLFTIPVEWTDQAEPDLFTVVSAGRSRFRVDDLLRLADLINVMRGRGKPCGPEEGADGL